ncbi:hypothetical protein OAH77_04470 [Flavobacteriaceae bacterium]|nr:hypothetical protein [Flavobacteriaceae bacterium]
MAKNIEILPYKDKSFAIFGFSEEHKEALGKNGLQLCYHKALTHPVSNKKQPAFFFGKKRKDYIITKLKIKGMI